MKNIQVAAYAATYSLLAAAALAAAAEQPTLGYDVVGLVLSLWSMKFG
ncbi:hypothetical protein SAMN05216188_13517 [Lentzea xinjiangensis]|uniref:Uncharacterized protein n=1 Tax=Lentzea xinjiangensis TaxID=402600 RepID=A0A1H9WIP9_9PSEU|nr:hypothetical protein [Lentzea xinjiangensis]SES33755.1 hypothetical protein SAMN05216188_13517 [Lentzea xinjiangensis]